MTGQSELVSFDGYIATMPLPQQLDFLALHGRLVHLNDQQKAWITEASSETEIAVWRIVHHAHHDGLDSLSGRSLAILNQSSHENMLSSRVLYLMHGQPEDRHSDPAMWPIYEEIDAQRRYVRRLTMPQRPTSALAAVIDVTFERVFSGEPYLRLATLARDIDAVVDRDAIKRLVDMATIEAYMRRSGFMTHDVVSAWYLLIELLHGGVEAAQSFLQRHPMRLRRFPWVLFGKTEHAGFDAVYRYCERHVRQ